VVFHEGMILAPPAGITLLAERERQTGLPRGGKYAIAATLKRVTETPPFYDHSPTRKGGGVFGPGKMGRKRGSGSLAAPPDVLYVMKKKRKLPLIVGKKRKSESSARKIKAKADHQVEVKVHEGKKEGEGKDSLQPDVSGQKRETHAHAAQEGEKNGMLFVGIC